MASDIYKYIRGCLFWAKWATIVLSIPFTLIQTGKLYELIGIDFIGLLEKSTYGKTYTCNLVNYFSRHIYPHPTPGEGANNVILSFDHYLQFNLKLYAVYIDASTHFISPKLYLYFLQKDIAVVFIPSTSYKSISLIEKLIDLLQQALKKRCEPGEEWEDALFWVVP